jgi:hypothetical protein
VIDVTSRADDHVVASTALTGILAHMRARRPQTLPVLGERIGQITAGSGHAAWREATGRRAEFDARPLRRRSISFSSEWLSVEVGELGNEARLIIKAAKIENERTILEAADDWYG